MSSKPRVPDVGEYVRGQVLPVIHDALAFAEHRLWQEA